MEFSNIGFPIALDVGNMTHIFRPFEMSSFEGAVTDTVSRLHGTSVKEDTFRPTKAAVALRREPVHTIGSTVRTPPKLSMLSVSDSTYTDAVGDRHFFFAPPKTCPLSQ